MGWHYESRFRRIWRPPSIADANRHGVPWSRRNAAQDRLDDLSFEHQKVAAESALGRAVQDSELKTRPQHGPLYTQYPAFPAARACLGLSAVCEFKAGIRRANALLLAAAKIPPAALVDLDPSAAAHASAFVVEAVSNRLCIDHLHRIDGLGAAESYRLFASGLIDLRFRALKDVILAAATMGDLIPGLLAREPLRRRMHPLTCKILAALAPACHAYEVAAADCAPEELPSAGVAMASAMILALVPFLPLKQESTPTPTDRTDEQARKLMRDATGPHRVPIQKPAPPQAGEDALTQPLVGTDERLPPSISQPGPWQLRPDGSEGDASGDQGAAQAPGNDGMDTGCIAGDDDHPAETSRLAPPDPRHVGEIQANAMLMRAALSITQAIGRSPWDDPRVDQVTDALQKALYSPGAVESELATRRHKVTAFGSGREGVIHEEALPKSHDRDALSCVREGAAVIERDLRRFRWFGQREDVEVDRLQPRGALDPGRLHCLGISPLHRRRWQRRHTTDYRGKPIVVLAKDGSSSNTTQTTFAGKILAAAFLRIERLARIRIFAADYSSARTSGPLVRWLYHPRKTPGRGPTDAADAVASLPAGGQGGNEDVLSISHIMREVLELPIDRKQPIIVINVTDGKFNSDLEELRRMIRMLREDDRISYSVVVLGDHPVNLPDAHHVIRIPASELDDAHQIARRIAAHVNTLVLRLRGMKGTSHV